MKAYDYVDAPFDESRIIYGGRSHWSYMVLAFVMLITLPLWGRK